jgi:hypothetical protein
VARIGFFGNRSRDADPEATVATASDADRERVVADNDRVADRNGDGVISESEARAARERVHTRLANRERAQAREAAASGDSRTEGRTMLLGGRKQPLTEAEAEQREADRVDLSNDANRATANRLLAERAAAEAAEDRAAVKEHPTVQDHPVVREAEPVTRPVEPVPAPEPKIRARTSMFATFALIFGLSAVYAALSGRLAPAALVLGLVGLVFSFGGLTATGRPRVTGSTMALLALILSVGGPVLAILAMNHSATWLDSDVDQVARLRDWLDAQLPFIRSW